MRLLGAIVAVIAAAAPASPARAGAVAAAAAPSGVPGTGPWSAATPQMAGDTPFGPGGLSCTGKDFCISVDAFGGTYLYQGGSWRKSPAVMPDTPKSIDDPHGYGPDYLDCASPSLCVAGGNDGAAWLWDGSSWRADFAPHATAQVVNPSCPRVSAVPVCYFDVGNTFARYTGGPAWTALGPIEPGPHPSTDTSLSCPTASFCEAVEATSPRALTWNGKSWSQPQAVPGLPSYAINTLSCGAAGQCVLFPASLNTPIRDIWRDTGGRWTAIKTPASGPLAGSQQEDPDCLSAAFCLVAALDGQLNGLLAVVTLGSPAGTAQVTSDTAVAGSAVAVSCGTVCAVGMTGGSFTDATLTAPAVTSVSPGFGPTTGIAPYLSDGLRPPPPVQVRGRGLELADSVFFGDVPAASWQVRGGDLLLVQPPPGKAGPAAVRIGWAGGTTGPAPGSAYRYSDLPLRVSVAGPPQVTGQTGQPPRMSVDLVIADQPVGLSRLVWQNLDGPGTGSALVGPLPPGSHRLQVYSGSAWPTSLRGPVRVCLDTGPSASACGYGQAAITPPPLTRQPWWAWLALAAGLLAGAAAASLISWLARRRQRRARPVPADQAA